MALDGLYCADLPLRNYTVHAHSLTPKFGWDRGWGAVFSRQPAISLKRGKIGLRLLLMTNRKSHTSYRFLFLIKKLSLKILFILNLTIRSSNLTLVILHLTKNSYVL